MWQEARKQEKHIRSVLVDHRKRAERRLNFYSQIRQDPIKFIRVYGTPAKINLDIEVRRAAENPKNMMPWVGDPSIIIDRFDARANLETYSSAKNLDIKLTTQEKIEGRLCNYERYRCLAHNDFLGVTESMALKQIEREEKYGDSMNKKLDGDSKDKKPEPKAAIGFVYEEGEIIAGKMPQSSKHAVGSDSDASEIDSDLDIDVELDLDSLEPEQRQELIDCSHNYGMKRSDFIRLLDADQVLESELRAAKIQEEEKLQHYRRPRRRHRVRHEFDKYGPNASGPKVGLLNGQPITRRKIYLSGASSDSESYGSPSSEEEEPIYRRRRSMREGGEGLSCAKPSLYDSKRPAVLIGGLTLVSFCDPKKRRRRFRDRPGRRWPTSRSKSRSSSSDSSAAGRYRRGGGRRSNKVEYITTFGDDGDADDSQDEHREFPLSQIPVMSAGRPSDAVSKVAASVISSMFKNSPNTSSRSKPAPSAKPKVPSSLSASRRRSSSCSRSSRSSKKTVERDRQYRKRRRSSSSSSSKSSAVKRQAQSRRQGSSTSSRSASVKIAKKARSPSGGEKRKVEPVPIRRYYRRELESDNEEKILSESSTESESESRGGGSSFADQDDKRRRYHHGDNDGGKKTASSSGNRYSNSANAHHSTSSFKDSHGKSSGPSKLTPQEILKRRMQAQLNKTVNAEKKAESERLEQQERERMAREEGLRKQALQIRQREIGKRLAERGLQHPLTNSYRRRSLSSSSSRSSSRSPRSPIVPSSHRLDSLSSSPVNLEVSPGGPSRSRPRRSPSPFRRRDYQSRYGVKGPRRQP
ncbi:hypothetical protein ACTXT7_010111 [Hymenolepis weldensis]